MNKQKHVCIYCYMRRGRTAAALETDWIDGIVCCESQPLKQHGSYSSRAESYQKTIGPPPIYCPYILEHSLTT